MPIIKKDLAYSFRDQQLHDLDLFRAYIGIRSIIGRRNFAATYKPAILSRMIGCKNKAAFEAFSQEPHLRPTIERYGKRYQMDHLLHTLRDRGFIMYLSPGGGDPAYQQVHATGGPGQADQTISEQIRHERTNQTGSSNYIMKQLYNDYHERIIRSSQASKETITRGSTGETSEKLKQYMARYWEKKAEQITPEARARN